jgi:hypothetical protein
MLNYVNLYRKNKFNSTNQVKDNPKVIKRMHLKVLYYKKFNTLLNHKKLISRIRVIYYYYYLLKVLKIFKIKFFNKFFL